MAMPTEWLERVRERCENPPEKASDLVRISGGLLRAGASYEDYEKWEAERRERTFVAIWKWYEYFTKPHLGGPRETQS